MPVPATHWDPIHGPIPVFVHQKGKKPGTLVVGTKSGHDKHEVLASQVKFKFGPDSEKFGIRFVDPYATTNESRALRSIVASLLREADKEENPEEGVDSLDSQIDKYLSDYEAEAKNAKNENLDFRMLTRRFLIEAGEDEESDEEDKGDEEGGEETEADKEPEKLAAEDINVKSFVTDVMRLVDNYDSLLEVRNTILRRAVNFLAKNYDTDVVDGFNSELLETYGVEIGKSQKDEEEDHQAPSAAEAGPMGGGGA